MKPFYRAWLIVIGLSLAGISYGQIKTEHFDRDPGWDGFNNRIVPAHSAISIQDFGYRRTNFAGRAAGEIGGRVQRSSLPAWYAQDIGRATLNDKLTASGTFAVTGIKGSKAAAVFGWFNSHQQPGGGRPWPLLGMEISYGRTGGRLVVRLITEQDACCGMSITPVIKPKHGPQASKRLPLRLDGTRYFWSLDYDPRGAGSQGQIRCRIQSNRPPHESFENKTWILDVPAELKRQGACFDRFGLINITKTGGALMIYFDDITRNGVRQDFTKNPGWIGSGNHGSFREVDQPGFQNFGFSKTQYAGGGSGEIGGTFWRSGQNWGYYANRLAALTLNNRMEAHGKVHLIVGAPDSSMYIGWFNVSDREDSPAQAGDFLGIVVEGPTRIGHYFAPAYAIDGERGRSRKGPVIVPGKTYEWSIVYDPRDVAIRATLDGESVTLPVSRHAKAAGSNFDHFGLLTAGPGGGEVRIFFDDLSYTASPK